MTFRRIGEGLAREVDRWIDDPALHEQIVLHAWQRTCGPTLAAHASDVELQGDVLHVTVADRRWKAVLEEMRGPLLRRLRAELGESAVRELRIELGGDQPPGEEPARKR